MYSDSFSLLFYAQHGSTALIIAVSEGYVNIVELLLARNEIEMNIQNKVI
jgi:hypothetical protein